MSEFKRTTSITGKYKELVIEDKDFVDPESGEIIDVVGQLSKIYGSNIFSLSTSMKTDTELGGEE